MSYLQCTDELRLLQSRQVNDAERALAKRSTELEIVNGEEPVLSESEFVISTDRPECMKPTSTPFSVCYWPWSLPDAIVGCIVERHCRTSAERESAHRSNC